VCLLFDNLELQRGSSKVHDEIAICDSRDFAMPAMPKTCHSVMIASLGLIM
jgi:hypothetical protein